MNLRNSFLVACLAFAAVANAQTSLPANTPRAVKFYYNTSCELTTPDKAFFYRESYLDFENILFSGICKDYVMINNKLMSEGFFDQGVNKGLHSDYFDNGKLESTIEYADEGFIIWELTTDKDEHQVAKGTGKFGLDCFAINTIENNGVTLGEGTVRGEFINGKRNGTWIYQTNAGVKTDEEVYDNGKFKQRTTWSTSGMVATQDTKKPIIISLTGILTEAFNFDKTQFQNLNDYMVKYAPPFDAGFRRWITYPGGMKKILLIIARGLHTDVPENVTVKISVDENGKFGKTKSSLLFGSDFGDEIKNLIRPHETKFLPAVRDGKPYAFTMKLPVANSPEWIQYLETATDDDVNAYLDQLNTEQ